MIVGVRLCIELSVMKNLPLQLDRRAFLKHAAAVAMPLFLTFNFYDMSQPKGIVMRESIYSVNETINRCVLLLQKKGATIYARINQQAEAHGAGISIKPIEFILFGNPAAGGAIMATNPLAALDLPLKIICWEDRLNKVWLAYNDSLYIEERYGLEHKENSPINIEPLATAVLNL